MLSTQACTACRAAVRLLEQIKDDDNLSFTLVEIDVALHPEYLQRYPIRQAPGIVLDGVLMFSGLPTEEQLKEKFLP